MISQSPNRLQCPTWCDQSEDWTFNPKTHCVEHFHMKETINIGDFTVAIEQLEEVGANFGKLHPAILRFYDAIPLEPESVDELIEGLKVTAEIGHAINEGRYHGKEVTSEDLAALQSEVTE